MLKAIKEFFFGTPVVIASPIVAEVKVAPQSFPLPTEVKATVKKPTVKKATTRAAKPATAKKTTAKKATKKSTSK